MANTTSLGPGHIYFADVSCYYELYRDRRDRLDTALHPMCNIKIHFHDCYEFMYVISGEADLLQPDRTTRVVGGQLIALASFVPHGYQTESAFRCSALIPRRLIANLPLAGKPFEHTVIDDPDGVLLDAIRLLHRVNQREGCFADIDDDTFEELIFSSAQAFVKLAAAAGGLTENSGTPVTVLRALEYINEHFREDLRIPELAHHLYSNQTTLAIQFKRVFGMTMKEYINHLRISEANRLLRTNPDMSVAEAAEMAGFGSIQTFYRVNKREPGGENGISAPINQQ